MFKSAGEQILLMGIHRKVEADDHPGTEPRPPTADEIATYRDTVRVVAEAIGATPEDLVDMAEGKAVIARPATPMEVESIISVWERTRVVPAQRRAVG